MYLDKRTLAQQINLTDERGNSALHVAAGVGNVHAGRWLIQHGAKIGSRNDDGRTPLHLASAGLHVDFIRLLLASTEAPDVLANAKDKDGLQPIHLSFFLGLVPGSNAGWHGLTAAEIMAGYEKGTWGRLTDHGRWSELDEDGVAGPFDQAVAALSEHTRKVARLSDRSARALILGLRRYPRAIVTDVLDKIVSVKLLIDTGRRMRDFALRNWRFGVETLEDGMFDTSVRAPPYCLEKLAPHVCGATSLASSFLARWYEDGPEVVLEDLFVSHLMRLRDEQWGGGDLPLMDGRGRWSFLVHVELAERRGRGGWNYVFDVYDWPYEVPDRERGIPIFSVRPASDGEARLWFYGANVAELADEYFEATSVEDVWYALTWRLRAWKGPSVPNIPRRYVLGNECDLKIEVVDAGEVWIEDHQRSQAGRACTFPLDWSNSGLGIGVQTVRGREVLMSVGGCGRLRRLVAMMRPGGSNVVEAWRLWRCRRSSVEEPAISKPKSHCASPFRRHVPVSGRRNGSRCRAGAPWVAAAASSLCFEAKACRA